MPIPETNPEAGVSDDGTVRDGAASPTYAAAFRCIGPACEDPCCGEWDIPLDPATYAKYRQFPAERLGDIISQFVTLNPAGRPASGYTQDYTQNYAQIHRKPSGLCPFWDADRLCSIQKEYGPQMLSASCSIFPRSLSRVGGVLEGTLSLSCPEAARNILFDRNFLLNEGDLFSGEFRTDNFGELARDGNSSDRKPYHSFFAVRALLIEMVRDRSRSIEQRLLLIGSLCERLQQTLNDGGDDAVAQFLGDYRATFATQAAHSGLDSVPSDPALKLEIVLKLTNDRVREKTCGKRFRDVFWNFVEGIAAPDGSASGDDISRFRQAEQSYYRPFFAQSQFILENYLLNYMLQNLFPIGREGYAGFGPRSMFDEFVLMTTQFAWINSLLIGVSGQHKEAFSTQHVVQVVQSFTREVEHYPPVLNSIVETIKQRKMDTLQGMALLLRN